MFNEFFQQHGRYINHWLLDKLAHGSSILSEFGALHLEFTYLSYITGIPEFKKKVENVRNFLLNAEKPEGLYPNYINADTGEWGQSEYQLFYDYHDIYSL